jgi:hypothetical protein
MLSFANRRLVVEIGQMRICAVQMIIWKVQMAIWKVETDICKFQMRVHATATRTNKELN